MTVKDWSNAWRLLGYIEGANDVVGEVPGHDEIQEAVNSLAEILERARPKEAGK